MNFTRNVSEGVRFGARRAPTCLHLAAATSLVLASLTASLCALAGNLDVPFEFHIDAQTLDKALLQFGAQAHMQISFAWDSSTSKLRTRELNGTFTGRQMLTELLKGTRLRYVAHEQTVEILPQAVAERNASPQVSKPPVSRRHDGSQKPNDPSAATLDPPGTARHQGTGHLIQALAE